MNAFSKKNLRRMMLDATRHVPEAYDLRLDSAGFVIISEFVEGVNRTQVSSITLEDVADVLGPEGGSYFDVEYGRFRAVTGHTTESFDYPEAQPPQHLFYLTKPRDRRRVEEVGLEAYRQRYIPVETSKDDALGTSRKRRIKKPVVITIEAQAAWEDGVLFYYYCNKWYVVDCPPDYLVLE